MDFQTLFSLHNLALLSDWLNETGELYVDVYWTKSGNSGTAFFIRSLNDLKDLIALAPSIQQIQPWTTIYFTILRKLQFPLRGIVDQEFLEQTLKQIPDNLPFEIAHIRYFPEMRYYAGDGKNHADLRRELTDNFGDYIGIGQEPVVDKVDSNTNEVFSVSFANNTKEVRKNQDFYEPYAKNPERYEWIEELWRT